MQQLQQLLQQQHQHQQSRAESLRKALFNGLMSYVRRIPYVRRQIEKQLGEVRDKMRHDFKEREDKAGVPHFNALPENGLPSSEVLSMMTRMRDAEVAGWKGGKVSGAVYHGGEELYALFVEVFRTFAASNPLHPDLFPSTRKFEAEVIRMTVNLFHGDAKACGTMTSGGTESILMACKSYREWGRERGIENPEIITPVSAHAAFDKAAEYFGIVVHRVPVGEDTRADLRAMRRLINTNTVALVGSAVPFPHGCMDDIVGLGQMAQEYGLGLHVDACLGGFFLPFVEMEGYPVPLFDFRVAGVTSISADMHKYGFTPKGTSVVMYRTPELRAHQFFAVSDWPGGIYNSPSMSGSRPGALVAGAWATMIVVGQSGYRKVMRDIMETRIAIEEGIREKMTELEVLGRPEGPIVSFRSRLPNLSTYVIADGMTKRGWNLNILQFPAAIHICCTRMTNARDFLRDLRDAVLDAHSHPENKDEGSAAIYGLATRIPDRSIVEVLAKEYLGVVLSTFDDEPAPAASSLKSESGSGVGKATPASPAAAAAPTPKSAKAPAAAAATPNGRRSRATKQ